MNKLIENCTIHGLNHIYLEKSKPAKFSWIVLFVFGICGITLNIVLISLRYLSNPILINHSSDSFSFQWPDLTFCNPSAPIDLNGEPLSLSYWLNMSQEINELAREISNNNYLEVMKPQIAGSTILERRTLILSSLDNAKLKLNTSRRFFNLIHYSISHNGMYFAETYEDFNLLYFALVNGNPLSSTQFVQITNNIPCYTYRIENLKLTDDRDISSITMRVRFDYDKYQLFDEQYVYGGVFLYITNKNELPQKKEIILQPGNDYEITLEQFRIEKLKKRNPCRTEKFNIELYDVSLLSVNIYEGGYIDCEKYVSQKIFVEKCNCYSPFLPIYKNESGFPRICYNATFYSRSEILDNAKCMYNIYNKFKRNDLFEIRAKKECNKYLSKKCNENQYKIRISKENSPKFYFPCSNFENKYENFVCENTTSQDLISKAYGSDMVRLVIKRYSKRKDLLLEEEEYPFSNLLSDVGGLMGLWLGMSFIGVVEALAIIYRFLVNKLRIPRNPSQNEENNYQPTEMLIMNN